MKRINVTIVSSGQVFSSYKNDSEYQTWIDTCIAQGVWGASGNYSIEVLDATVELEAKRQAIETTPKSSFDSHANSTSNPHSVTKTQVGLSNVPDVDATLRSNHTGTQLSSTISDFNEAAQDAVGAALASSSDIQFTYPDALNQISATLTDTGVVASTYNAVTVDSKGRVIFGVNSAPVTRFSYTLDTNTAVSTNTYTTVAGLTTDSLPIGLYKVSFIGRIQSGSTTSGVGVRVSNGSSTVSNIAVKWFISQGASGTALNYSYDQVATTTNLTSASTAVANSPFIVQGEGIVNITTQGTLVLQIRPESNGTAATLLPISTLILELI